MSLSDAESRISSATTPGTAAAVDAEAAVCVGGDAAGADALAALLLPMMVTLLLPPMVAIQGKVGWDRGARRMRS